MLLFLYFLSLPYIFSCIASSLHHFHPFSQKSNFFCLSFFYFAVFLFYSLLFFSIFPFFRPSLSFKPHKNISFKAKKDCKRNFKRASIWSGMWHVRFTTAPLKALFIKKKGYFQLYFSIKVLCIVLLH